MFTQFYREINFPEDRIKIKEFKARSGGRGSKCRGSKINERKDSVASILNYLDGERGGSALQVDKIERRKDDIKLCFPLERTQQWTVGNSERWENFTKTSLLKLYILSRLLYDFYYLFFFFLFGFSLH